MFNRNKLRLKASRRAAAVVELAVCLPVIMLVVLGSLEAANMLFVRQAAVQAAYEAAKAAARSTGSVARGRQLAEEVLRARRINRPTIRFAPANVDDLAPGTPFNCEIEINSAERSITGSSVFAGLTIRTVASMVKE